MQVYLAGVTSAKEFLFEDDFSFAKRLYMLESFIIFLIGNTKYFRLLKVFCLIAVLLRLWQESIYRLKI